ncbi:MAG: hypothetical protein KGL53_14875, partial [Elusimicrobia bacterium]|nr:hypothetical protein [Elusimicrobiota bacterium]
MRRALFLAAALAAAAPARAATDWFVGNGKAGSLTLSTTRVENSTATTLFINVNPGDTIVQVQSNAAFTSGDLVFLIQMYGTGAGTYEFARVLDTVGAHLDLTSGTVHGYNTPGAEVLRVVEYSSVTLNSGAGWDAPSFSSTTSQGGVFVAAVRGDMTINAGALLTMQSGGFPGGQGVAGSNGYQGYGTSGLGAQSTAANGNAGGGGLMSTGGGGGGG